MAAISANDRQELVALYLTMFGRAPTTIELAESVVARENGSTLAQVATTLSAKTEFALTASKDADSFATYLANALLAADTPASARAWAINWVVTQVQGTKTKAQVIAEAVQAIRATTNTNYTTAKAELTADVTASLTAIDNPAPVITTTALTVGIDSFPGSSGTDNFNASLNASDATKNTLNSADNINGNTGTDTLTIAASGTGATTVSGVTLTSVENLIITNGATAAHTFDGSLSTGITGITVSGSNAAVTVSNLKAIPAVTLNGNASDVTVGLQAAATIGLADSASVSLNASNTATSGTLTIDGVETLNVDVSGSTGSASTLTTAGTTLTLADNALQTLAITGTGGSWLAATLSGATGTTTGTVTSAGGADNVTLTAGGSAKLSVAMGAGNDGVSLGTVVATYTVDGGDGTDTLTYSGATAVTSTLAANFKGFEAVKLTNATPAGFQMGVATVTYTTAAAGTYTGLTVATAGAVVNLEAGGTATLAANTGASPANEYTGTADAVTLNVGRSNTTGNLTGSLSSSGVETVTVNNLALGSDTTSTRTNAITDAKVKTIIVTGGQATTISGGGAALTKVDASGVAGAVTISATVAAAGAALIGGGGNDVLAGGAGTDSLTGGAGNDSLTGGAGNDVIDGGTGVNTIAGGAGVDTMTGSTTATEATTYQFASNDTTNITPVTISTGGNSDTITNFKTGVDKIAITGASAPTSFLGNFTNIQQALAAAASNAVANAAAYVTGEGSLYVFRNAGGTLNVDDIVIKLTGVTALVAGDLLLGSNAGGSAITSATTSTTVLNVALTGTAVGTSNSPLLNTTDLNDSVGANTVNIIAATLTGGLGVDSITIANASTSTTASHYTVAMGANVTGFESVTLPNAVSATGSTFTLDTASVAANSTFTVDGSAHAGADSNGTQIATALTITAAAAGANAKVSLVGGAGNDSLTGGASNDTINGGNGDDTLIGAAGTNSIVGGAGNDSVTGTSATDIIDGGAGNDTVNLTAALTLTGSLAGGAGTADALLIGVTATNLAGGTVSGFENLTLVNNSSTTMTLAQLAGFTGTTTAAATETIVLTGAGGSVTKPTAVEVLTATALTSAVTVTTASIAGLSIAGSTVTDVTNTITVTGDTASDVSIVGGGANDTVSLAHGATGTFTNADTLTGGAGTDTLNITGNIALTITLDGDQTGFEVMTFANTTTAVSVTTADANVASGATLTVTTSQTTGALTFNGAAEADGKFSMTGGGGDDALTGGSGVDTLNGGAGGDTLAGGAGNDVLDGGAGNNTFNGGAGNDTLTLSSGGGDTVHLTSGSIFGGTGTDNPTTIFVDTATAWAQASDFLRLGIGNLATTATAAVTLSNANGGDIAAIAFGAGTTTSVALNATVDAAAATSHLIKMTSTTANSFASAIGSGSITIANFANNLNLGGDAGAAEGLAVLWYDSVNTRAVLSVFVAANADTALDAADAARVHDVLYLNGVDAAGFTAIVTGNVGFGG